MEETENKKYEFDSARNVLVVTTQSTGPVMFGADEVGVFENHQVITYDEAGMRKCISGIIKQRADWEKAISKTKADLAALPDVEAAYRELLPIDTYEKFLKLSELSVAHNQKLALNQQLSSQEVGYKKMVRDLEQLEANVRLCKPVKGARR